MSRPTSEITKKEFRFLKVGQYVRDNISPEELKEFIAYLKTYITKK